LDNIEADLRLVLTLARSEVDGLLAKLRAGQVDGSCYEGSCSCLLGTIATERHCAYTDIPGLAPNSSRPAERWFLGIKPGDTPENSQIAKITEEWIEKFLAENPVETEAVEA
jgi:hypothetical protein